MKVKWFRGCNPIWRIVVGRLAVMWWADEVGRSIRKTGKSTYVVETRRLSVMWNA